jgi:hypothetical protein
MCANRCPSRLGAGASEPLGNHMTQRAPASHSFHAPPAPHRTRALRRMRTARLDAMFGAPPPDAFAAPASPIDCALRWSYMGVCLLAMLAAAAVASGEAASAELRLATVAVTHAVPAPDICTATDQPIHPPNDSTMKETP